MRSGRGVLRGKPRNVAKRTITISLFVQEGGKSDLTQVAFSFMFLPYSYLGLVHCHVFPFLLC